MMTRKDYVKVAGILKKYRSVIGTQDYSELCNDFADYMEDDNPKFQDLVFIDACGVEEVQA
jgi:hypothetical protein